MRGLIILMVFLIQSVGYATDESRCVDPSSPPFETPSKRSLQPLESQVIGIYQYFRGRHEPMIEEASVLLLNLESEEVGCAKPVDSIVLFIEPESYSDKRCEFNGHQMFHRHEIDLRRTPYNKAVKQATEWVTDLVGVDIPECPSQCSFASTSKFRIVNDVLEIQTNLHCTSRRSSWKNRIRTALLKEWYCPKDSITAQN